jgi:hypothetical protein
MTMTLIETKTLLSAQASIEFTSIPQDGTDLLVVFSARTNGSGNTMNITFNGNTSDYTNRTLQGNGTAPSSFGTFGRYAGLIAESSETANTFGNGSIYIPNYTASVNKSYSSDSVSENNGSQSYQALIAGLWSNTAAITSLLVSPLSGSFIAGSTVSLYGITKGSDGIVTTS